MTYNYEVFHLDPRTRQIPNDGVAKVGEPQDAKAWSVLRYELESFVCDGNYHAGLVRVLRSFLDQLDRDIQPAVWISGFFGSGKSHFARVLEYLWRDLALPDGASARSLVTVPEDVRESLVELTNRARRGGGLWSAAGTLQSGTHGAVRLAILGVVLSSARLPTNYAQARLALWLREKGYEDKVISTLTQQGLDFAGELQNMYVSPPLADAILQVMPDFAKSNSDARALFREQFPDRADDVSNEEMLTLMERVLRSQATGKRHELPYTLIVLDELQQYLGGDPGSSPIQQVIEACCSHFGARLLFVATGQSAITANSAMQKLQARFTVRVELSDTDVTQVVRQVALRKRPEHTLDLQHVLDQQSGEIDRQLRGTRIGPMPADRADLVASYPLLPTRQRFWEAVLRAVDPSGTAGMLRTQLRIVMDAVKTTAALPLGHVIPADFIYEQQRLGMRNSGVLSVDYDTIITNLKGATEPAPLAARLCGLIFLIDKLDRDGPLATGIRPTVETLTDLLVEDLSGGRVALHRAVGETLQRLCDAGTLLDIGGQYHLQTPESAAWSQAYQLRLRQTNNDMPRLESERRDALKGLVTKSVHSASSVKMGRSKTERKAEQIFSLTVPSLSGDAIPLWVRDGWNVTEATALQEARDLGEENPIITIFLPRLNADALRATLAQQIAADAVLKEQPTPQTPSAQEAKQAIVSQHVAAIARLGQQLGAVLEQALVIQGGGHVIEGVPLIEKVKEALEAATKRRYPRFDEGDHADWGSAFDRAREGAEDALKRVGFEGEPALHPVCHAILDYIGSAAQKGDAIRKQFAAAPYGWPQDAIDAALTILARCGQLRATRDGQIQTAKQLTHAQISQTLFQSENVTITTNERIALRKMLQSVGLTVQPGNEAAALDVALAQMSTLAHQAGGAPPCPAPPDMAVLDAISSAQGNERLKRAAAHASDIPLLHDNWKVQRATIEARLPRWDTLSRLLRHAEGMPVAATITPQVEAIRDQRQLLAEPDPVPPLAVDVAGALRQALSAVVARQAEVFAAQEARLRDLPEWGRLTESQRATVLRDQRLHIVPTLPEIGTEVQVLAALDALPLAQRQTEIDALPQRFAAAKAAASTLLEPKTTRLYPFAATVHTRQDVESYTTALRDRLLRQIESGPVYIEGE